MWPFCYHQAFTPGVKRQEPNYINVWYKFSWVRDWTRLRNFFTVPGDTRILQVVLSFKFHPLAVRIILLTFVNYPDTVTLKVIGIHSVKSVRIRSFSGPYNPENTDQKNSKYGHFLRSDIYETQFKVNISHFCYEIPFSLVWFPVSSRLVLRILRVFDRFWLVHLVSSMFLIEISK